MHQINTQNRLWCYFLVISFFFSYFDEARAVDSSTEGVFYFKYFSDHKHSNIRYPWGSHKIVTCFFKSRMVLSQMHDFLILNLRRVVDDAILSHVSLKSLAYTNRRIPFEIPWKIHNCPQCRQSVDLIYTNILVILKEYYIYRSLYSADSVVYVAPMSWSIFF